MTALWLRTTLRKQLLGHPRAMPGVWGGFALHRILPRKEFMGRAFENPYRSMPFACASGSCKRLPPHRLHSRRIVGVRRRCRFSPVLDGRAVDKRKKPVSEGPAQTMTSSGDTMPNSEKLSMLPPELPSPFLWGGLYALRAWSTSE